MKNDLEAFAKDLADGYSRVAKAAADAERERLLPLLAGIYAAYDYALSRDGAKIPTPLMAAIESAKVKTGSVTTPVFRRAEPEWAKNPDYDQSPRGGRMAPGS